MMPRTVAFVAGRRTCNNRAQTRSTPSKDEYHGLHEYGLSGDAHKVPESRHQRYGASHEPELGERGTGDGGTRGHGGARGQISALRSITEGATGAFDMEIASVFRHRIWKLGSDYYCLLVRNSKLLHISCR